MKSALKGLVLELKGISCTLPVFCLETGPSPDPYCWINARHFLRSAHPAGQNHFSYFFFLRNGRSAFTARWYNTGVTFWQGIWCRFQVAPSNYSSDYFQTAVQLRSALGFGACVLTWFGELNRGHLWRCLISDPDLTLQAVLQWQQHKIYLHHHKALFKMSV